jgi:hypothetical protein
LPRFCERTGWAGFGIFEQNCHLHCHIAVATIIENNNKNPTKIMKKTSILLAGMAALFMLFQTSPLVAREKGKAGKEMTITGEAKCAKCALHETDKCQTVIQAENRKGKMVTYYLEPNDVAKNFHENVCKGAKKVTATGTVKVVDKKHELTATKIELAEK